MSIHGVLAALLTSTALGGYAPLTLIQMRRFYLLGLEVQKFGVMRADYHMPSGVPKDHFVGSMVSRHTITDFTGLMSSSLVQGIILGFTGLMPTLNGLHTALQMTEVFGYGARYGASYGG